MSIAFQTEYIAVVSTSHVTEEDMSILEQWAVGIETKNLICRLSSDNGVLVSLVDLFYISDEPCRLSKECVAILWQAQEQNYNWVLFAHRGQRYNGLATFDW